MLAPPAWGVCSGPSTLQEQIRQSQSVWIGTVEDANPIAASDPDQWKLLVLVQGILKGPTIRQTPARTVLLGFGGTVTRDEVRSVRARLEQGNYLFTVVSEGSDFRNLGCGAPVPAADGLPLAQEVLGAKVRPALPPAGRPAGLVITIALGVTIGIAAVALARRWFRNYPGGGRPER